MPKLVGAAFVFIDPALERPGDAVLRNWFGRADTETGIHPDAADAPGRVYARLYDAIRAGTCAATPVGWQFLQETRRVTPEHFPRG